MTDISAIAQKTTRKLLDKLGLEQGAKGRRYCRDFYGAAAIIAQALRDYHAAEVKPLVEAGRNLTAEIPKYGIHQPICDTNIAFFGKELREALAPYEKDKSDGTN